MPRSPVSGSKAQRIESLLLAGVSDAEIARRVGTTNGYISWLRWRLNRRDARRIYERDRKREKSAKARAYARDYERARRAGLSVEACRAAGREASARV